MQQEVHIDIWTITVSSEVRSSSHMTSSHHTIKTDDDKSMSRSLQKECNYVHLLKYCHYVQFWDTDSFIKDSKILMEQTLKLQLIGTSALHSARSDSDFEFFHHPPFISHCCHVSWMLLCSCHNSDSCDILRKKKVQRKKETAVYLLYMSLDRKSSYCMAWWCSLSYRAINRVWRCPDAGSQDTCGITLTHFNTQSNMKTYLTKTTFT